MSVAASGGLTVRLAEARDLPSMVAIEEASFADPWTVETFSSALLLQRMRLYVAEEPADEGKGSGLVLAGYVVALLLGGEAEIADLAVDPRVRRRGIGGVLLDRVLGDVSSRGVLEVFLEVRESNSAARTLYESRGFVTVGRRRGYYRHPPEDALILKRENGPM
ncbi:MAG: ribosomal protein S18-alanine N-acetyltransferase [bacterium]